MSKYCQYCGNEVEDNSVFCENCGKSLVDAVVMENRQPQKGEKRCKTCGEIHGKKIKFCPNCGVNSRQIVAAKLTNCKGCGHSIAANAVKCPSCEKKTHYNFKITMLIVGIFFAVILVMASLLNDDSTVSKTASTNTPIEASTGEPVSNKKSEQQDNTLYTDEFFDVEFMELADVPAVTACSLQLKVTNKSAHKVTLMLDDVYCNDIAVETGTAMPIELEPGKVSTTPFILFTGVTGYSADEIKKIEFRVEGMNDNFDTIHKTAKIIKEM